MRLALGETRSRTQLGLFCLQLGPRAAPAGPARHARAPVGPAVFSAFAGVPLKLGGLSSQLSAQRARTPSSLAASVNAVDVVAFGPPGHALDASPRFTHACLPS